jgi:beta-galactosidase/beta-glucuronidase
MEHLHPNYGLTKIKREGFIDESFTSPLPRAVIRPNTYILLDGEWRFALDSKDRGLQERWHIAHHYQYTVLWPGTIEEHIAAINNSHSHNEWTDAVIGWYEREFPLPDKHNLSPNSMLQLTFGACGYETRVWLNGYLLKTVEGEDVHMGEYTSFSYELEDKDLRPVNRITVRVANTKDANIPRGKQESFVYKRGGIWYQTYSGAVRSIWLEVIERNRLRSRVAVVSIVEDRMVRFNVTTHIHDPGNYTIRLKVFKKRQEAPEPIAIDDFLLALEAGEKEQLLVLEVPGAELWSPENPCLYRLTAQLVDAQGYVAEIETNFGLRKIEARGRYIYLNNEPIYLDGILYQPGVATYEEIKMHMLAIKELGCNLMRIHISGVDPRVYKLADRIGMLLWVEVPSPHRSSRRSRDNHHKELFRMLPLMQTHPSIVIWSLYNEDWGAQDIATNTPTRQYITTMYDYMHLNHPQFLVVDNDGWHHISLRGKLKSDLLTAHLYTSHIEKWREMLTNLTEGKATAVTAFALIVGDPFFYRKQLPLIVSEWGGFGFINYGGPKQIDERAALIQQFKQELMNYAIAGDVYTQATDIEEEQNGLIDFKTGKPKVPAGTLGSKKK